MKLMDFNAILYEDTTMSNRGYDNTQWLEQLNEVVGKNDQKLKLYGIGNIKAGHLWIYL